MLAFTHLTQRLLLAADEAVAAEESADAGNAFADILGRSPTDLAILVGIVIACIIGGIILSMPLGAAVKHAMTKSKHTSTLAVQFVGSWVRRIGALLGFIVGLETIGIATAPIIAGFSVFGVVAGFAFKDTLSNLASGVLLMFYAPFDKDELVEIGGKVGVVQDVSIVATTIITPDGKMVIMPNAAVWGSPILNITRTPRLRVEVEFGVAYGADLDQVAAVTLETLRQIPNVVLEGDEEPMCAVVNWGASSVDHIARVWVENAHYWGTKFAMSKALKQAMDANGIEIPFPQRVVHMVGNDS